MIHPDIESQGDSENLTRILVKAVIVQFTLNEKQDKDAAGDSNSKTDNVDERISSMLLDDSQYDCDVVLDHYFLFY
jgi:hypothetical protein